MSRCTSDMEFKGPESGQLGPGLQEALCGSPSSTRLGKNSIGDSQFYFCILLTHNVSLQALNDLRPG